jgi:hypothetical protein
MYVSPALRKLRTLQLLSCGASTSRLPDLWNYYKICINIHILIFEMYCNIHVYVHVFMYIYIRNLKDPTGLVLRSIYIKTIRPMKLLRDMYQYLRIFVYIYIWILRTLQLLSGGASTSRLPDRYNHTY